MTMWRPRLDDTKPLYLSIADSMEDDIRSGRLKAGERLPPHRDLAWALKITTGTVTRGYREAEARGLVSGHVGRGSFVRGAARPVPIGAGLDQEVTDLSHSMPPPVITESDFDAALTYIAREPERLRLLDYAPPEGLAHWREVGAAWLQRSGVPVVAPDLITTAGAYWGLHVCLSLLAKPGAGLMAEALNYPVLKPLMAQLQLQPRPIEMTTSGIDLVSLEQTAKQGKAQLLYLVPSYQNPTTVCLTLERRLAIVEIARRYDLMIIEDDLFRSLDDRPPPPSFYELAPERCYYISSLSKSLAPGLRMGFLVSPPGQSQSMLMQQRTNGSRITGLTAEIARYWMETGIAEQLITKIRCELRERRHIFCDIFAGADYLCAPGAPHAWVQLPSAWTGTSFAAHALSLGVKISPGAAFRFGNHETDRWFRLCFGPARTQAVLRQALSTLKQLADRRLQDEFSAIA